jgi:hypothetical protein
VTGAVGPFCGESYSPPKCDAPAASLTVGLVSSVVPYVGAAAAAALAVLLVRLLPSCCRAVVLAVQSQTSSRSNDACVSDDVSTAL